jgi:SAM-dependent methyltransferase
MERSCFEAAPEFITRDHRRDRSFYPVTIDNMHRKHMVLLPPETLVGKSVLDLGCCLGATGHWALSNGAVRYVGIEAQHEYVEVARELLTKHHGDAAEVVEQSIESWLETNTDVYDIVCLFGVLYAFTDYYSVLVQSASCCRETIAIESVYHDRARLGEDFCGVQFVDDQHINLATGNASLVGRGSRVSPAGLAFVLRDVGFETSGVRVPVPPQSGIDVYAIEPKPGSRGRFLIRFDRTGNTRPALSDDLRGARTGAIIPWKTI